VTKEVVSGQGAYQVMGAMLCASVGGWGVDPPVLVLIGPSPPV